MGAMWVQPQSKNGKKQQIIANFQVAQKPKKARKIGLCADFTRKYNIDFQRTCLTYAEVQFLPGAHTSKALFYRHLEAFLFFIFMTRPCVNGCNAGATPQF